MSHTEMKHTAQDELMTWMVGAITADKESYEPDPEKQREMRRQARRAMKVFGVESFPGLGNVNDKD